MHPRARRRQGPARMCMCAWKDKYKRKKYSCRRKKCEVETFLDRCATGLLHSIGGMHTKAKLKIICTIEAKDLFKNNRSIERNAPQRKSTTSPTCAWNSAAAQSCVQCSAAQGSHCSERSGAEVRTEQRSDAKVREADPHRRFFTDAASSLEMRFPCKLWKEAVAWLKVERKNCVYVYLNIYIYIIL